jgi:hypothetical protein
MECMIQNLFNHLEKQSPVNLPFCVSWKDKTVKDNEYLGFTFDAEDFKACRRSLRKESTGEFIGYNTERIPIEERWSARFFELDKIFKCVNMNNVDKLESPWYYNISSWDGLCAYLGAKEYKKLDKPVHLGYHEWNPVGVNNEEE